MQEMALNDKKFCLLCSISQEPCIIGLSFMVHVCKIIVSLGAFFILSKFQFWGGCEGVKGQKMTQNDKKISVALHISGIMHHMIFIYGTHV